MLNDLHKDRWRNELFEDVNIFTIFSLLLCCKESIQNVSELFSKHPIKVSGLTMVHDKQQLEIHFDYGWRNSKVQIIAT